MALSEERRMADNRVMFIYYFVHVSRPNDESRRILLRLLDGISEAADIAYRKGESLLMKAGPEPGPVAKTVRLTVGIPLVLEDETVIPLSWQATGVTRLFPKLEAELRLAPVSDRVSKLSLQGSYQPPLGALGEALDRAVLHRVAESTIKHFVDRIGQAVVGWPQETKEAVG